MRFSWAGGDGGGLRGDGTAVTGAGLGVGAANVRGRSGMLVNTDAASDGAVAGANLGVGWATGFGSAPGAKTLPGGGADGAAAVGKTKVGGRGGACGWSTGA
jgi:hypothetical protein